MAGLFGSGPSSNILQTVQSSYGDMLNAEKQKGVSAQAAMGAFGQAISPKAIGMNQFKNDFKGADWSKPETYQRAGEQIMQFDPNGGLAMMDKGRVLASSLAPKPQEFFGSEKTVDGVTYKGAVNKGSGVFTSYGGTGKPETKAKVGLGNINDYTTESWQAYSISGDSKDLVAKPPVDSGVGLGKVADYTPESWQAYSISGNSKDLVAKSDKVDTVGLGNVSNYTTKSWKAYLNSGKKTDLVPKDDKGDTVGLGNVSDYTPDSWKKFKKSNNTLDLVPKSDKGDTVGLGKVSDYTAESWQAYSISNNKQDLVAKTTSEQEVSLGKVSDYTAESWQAYSISNNKQDLVAKTPLEQKVSLGKVSDYTAESWQAYSISNNKQDLVAKVDREPAPTYRQATNDQGAPILEDWNGTEWVETGKPPTNESKEERIKRQFTQTQSLRQELSKDMNYKNFKESELQFAKIKTSAEADSAAGDMSLIFAYMKMLDPDSVVREGEQATAENARGIPDTIKNVYNKAMNGEKMGVDQRADFVKVGGTLFTKIKKLAGPTISKIKGVTKRYELNQDDVFGSVDKKIEINFMFSGVDRDNKGEMAIIMESLTQSERAILQQMIADKEF